MNTSTAESNAGNAVIGVSATGGLVATINEYAVVLSLGLTLLGILIGLFFHILALKDRRNQMKLELATVQSEKIIELERHVARLERDAKMQNEHGA